ncbi:hypothetical protein ACWGJ9_08050 [Curtobacterium citreum]
MTDGNAGRAFSWQQPLSGQAAIDKLHADLTSFAETLQDHNTDRSPLGQLTPALTVFSTEAMAGNLITRLGGYLILDKHANHLEDIDQLPECGWHAVVRIPTATATVEASFAINPHDEDPVPAIDVREIGSGSDVTEAEQNVVLVLDQAAEWAREEFRKMGPPRPSNN